MQTGHSTGVTSGPLRLIRLLRLARVARMAKLMRFFPGLATMIRGLRSSSYAVCNSLMLCGMLIYTFGIFFRHILENDESAGECYGTLLRTMYTLLIDGVLGDSLENALDPLFQGNDIGSKLAVPVFILFVCLSAILVMNMLVGVMVE